jgi:hypothetical protein
MTKPLNHEKLKTKLKSLERSHVESFYIRLHRAISWQRAATENKDNQDFQIIAYWISLNSCYAISGDVDRAAESSKLTEFFEKIINVDKEGKIYELFWTEFPGVIRVLLNNQFIYKRYWLFQRGEVTSWKAEFEKDNHRALMLLQNPNRSVELIQLVMRRLYQMRNQLIHGGATYQSRVNRNQVRDSANLLGKLIPLIIEIMIDNPDEAWGDIYYPVVDARTDAKK